MMERRSFLKALGLIHFAFKAVVEAQVPVDGMADGGQITRDLENMFTLLRERTGLEPVSLIMNPSVWKKLKGVGLV